MTACRGKKEDAIEAEILGYLHWKRIKSLWKNDIKWFYNQKEGFYSKNNSPFIKPWISDISFLYKGTFVCIEVKRPNEMKFFDKTPLEAKNEFILAKSRFRNWKPLSAITIKKYQHAIEQATFIEQIKKDGWIWFFASSLQQTLERLKENGIDLEN